MGSKIIQAPVNAFGDETSLTASFIDAEKSIALCEVISCLAHEIRNRLVPVGGNTRLLLKREDKDKDRVSKLGVILDEVERLEAYLVELSSYASPRSPSFESLDIAETIRISTSYLEDDLERAGLTIKFTPETPSISIKADRMQLSQVIFILLRNAIHDPAGKGKIEINLWIENDYCFLKLTDMRSGSAAGRLKEWFSPLLPDNPLGKGLGLSMVQHILHNHGGMIFLVEQKHPAITILLPLSQP